MAFDSGSYTVLTMKKKQQALFEDSPVNAAHPPVQISIIGQIGWEVAAADIFAQVAAADPKATLEVALHSPGGSIFDGYLIHNSLIAHPGPVTVTILGLAASAGAWIPLAADRGQVRMHKLGQWMTHEGRGGCWGTATDMERQMKILRALDKQMAELLADQSGKSLKDVLDLMTAETYLTADEALEAGFVDEVIEGRKPAEALDLENLAHVPADIKALFGAQAPVAAVDPIAALLVGAVDLRQSEVPHPTPVSLLDSVAAAFPASPQEGV